LRILLTGADGFTGVYFTQAALQHQHEIIPLKAFLNDIDALNAEVATIKPDAVVHLAAISFVGHADNEAFYKVNVVGTDNLLKAIYAVNTNTRVLIAGSANIYGNPNVSVITEESPPSPVNHYAASKLAMEFMVKTWFDKLPIVITRPFNYTGVGQHENFLIPKIVNHFKRSEKTIELGNLDVSRDFSDVRDVVKAYVKLIESPVKSEVVNICTGKAIALKEIMAEMSVIAGYKMEVQVNPAFVRANEIFSLCGDNQKLQRLIGFVPNTPLANTLAEMYNAKS
jgi:GDP-6-deoxy-D-talose 4-dehydrogenase